MHGEPWAVSQRPIVCPYHTWTYSTAGELIATPGRVPTPDFRPEDYSLYPVAVDSWGGFVFVSLETPATTLDEFLGDEARLLRSWPLAEMVSVQTEQRTLACNWKVFWENYSECYHCPRVHPELCKVVGIYGKGFIDHTEAPDWMPADEQDNGKPALAPGHRTWAIGGETGLPDIPGLAVEAQAAGMTFASFTASMFVIAHRDYARSVRLLPLGPELVELTVDWLLPPVPRMPARRLSRRCSTESPGCRTGRPRLRTQPGTEEPAAQTRRADAAGTQSRRFPPLAAGAARGDGLPGMTRHASFIVLFRGLLVAGAVACSMGACGRTVPAAGEPAPGIFIRDVMLASPERDAAHGPVSVRIAGDRIGEIGEDLHPGADDTVIEGSGRYLAPGLIDSHVHLADIPGFRPEDVEAHAAAAAAALAQTPRAYLFHGFTSVIDLAGRSEAIGAWNAQDLHPHAYYCGAAPVQDGYPTNYVPAPQRYELVPDYLYYPAGGAALPIGAEAAEHTPQAVVARIAGDGAICVKSYYERGFGQARNQLPVPSVALMQELVAAAHARELPVLLHANAEAAQAFGVAAGVDAFAHGMWHWNDVEATRVEGVVADEIRQAVAAGIALQPTIQVLYGEGELLDPDFLERPALADVYPEAQLEFYASADGQWFRDILANNVYTEGWSPESPFVQRVKAASAFFAAEGGRLLFGSDTPSAPTYANPPGLNSRWEMDRWIEAGMPAREVFRAATIGNAAWSSGLDDEIGTVAAGKSARTCSLLDRNPFDPGRGPPRHRHRAFVAGARSRARAAAARGRRLLTRCLRGNCVGLRGANHPAPAPRSRAGDPFHFVSSERLQGRHRRAEHSPPPTRASGERPHPRPSRPRFRRNAAPVRRRRARVPRRVMTTRGRACATSTLL